jgi:hypothetical protein
LDLSPTRSCHRQLCVSSESPGTIATTKNRPTLQPPFGHRRCREHSTSGEITLIDTMEIPRYTSAHRTSYAPPEIFVQSSNSGERRGMAAHMGFSSMPFSAPSTSIPMAIPNTRDDDDPPPPLPPPRIIPTEHDSVAGVDAGWQWSNSREEGNSWGRPANIKPGSSLYGSSSESFEATRGPEYRRGSSASTIKSASGLDAGPASYSRADEGYASLSTAHSMKSFR